jgi:hypothetical protein
MKFNSKEELHKFLTTTSAPLPSGAAAPEVLVKYALVDAAKNSFISHIKVEGNVNWTGLSEMPHQTAEASIDARRQEGIPADFLCVNWELGTTRFYVDRSVYALAKVLTFNKLLIDTFNGLRIMPLDASNEYLVGYNVSADDLKAMRRLLQQNRLTTPQVSGSESINNSASNNIAGSAPAAKEATVASNYTTDNKISNGASPAAKGGEGSTVDKIRSRGQVVGNKAFRAAVAGVQTGAATALVDVAVERTVALLGESVPSLASFAQDPTTRPLVVAFVGAALVTASEGFGAPSGVGKLGERAIAGASYDLTRNLASALASLAADAGILAVAERLSNAADDGVAPLTVAS